MRSNHRPSKFKEYSNKPLENTNNELSEESKTRSRKQYVVEVDLTSQNIRPIGTSIANSTFHPTVTNSSTKLLLPPASPKLQITRDNIRMEPVPKEYIEKLNRASDDLRSFEAENTRLIIVNQKTEQRNMELQTIIVKLQQQLSLQRSTSPPALGPEINRYRTALQQKQAQIRGYCSRIKLIEQKLEEYELQRKANAILTNYYATLSSLFGKEQLEVEELRVMIEQAVLDSRQYERMINNEHALKHQQNEDLERAIKNYNAATFDKNNLQLKLINMSDERQELLRKLDLDRKKLDRSTNEIQSLRNALEALRMDNENIKIQLQRPTPMVDNSQTAKKLQQQLQICQKDNDSLKRQTAELRRVVQSYKTTLSQTEDAHSRETQHMSSMLAELRKNYYQNSHKLTMSQSVEDAAMLKQALSEANKTIQHLTQAHSRHTNNAEDAHRLRQQMADVKAKYYNLESDYDTLSRQTKNESRLSQELKLQLESLRQQLRALQNNTIHQQQLNILQKELELQRATRRQFQRELAIKSSQYNFVQSQLANYHNTMSEKSQRRTLYEQTIQDVEYSNRQLQQQLSTLQKEYGELQRSSEQRHLSDKQQMKKYSLEMTDNLNRMRQLVDEKHLLESQLSQTKYVLEDVRQQLVNNVSEKDNQIEKLGITISQSQQHIQNAQNEYSGRLIETQGQLMDAQTQYNNLQNQCANMHNEYNNILSQYNNLQNQYNNLQAHYTNLQNQNTSRQSQHTNIQNQLIQVQNQLELAEQYRLKLHEEVREKTANLSYQSQQLDSANAMIRKLQSELSKVSISLNEQCLDMQSHNREMSVQIGHLNQQLVELQIELENSNLQLQRAKNQLNARTDRCLQFEKACDEGEVEIRRLRQTLSNSQAQMRHLLAQQQHMLPARMRQKEDQICRLKEDINIKLQQLSWAKNENKSIIEKYQMRQSSMESTIKELEGRLSGATDELNNQDIKMLELKKLYESQIASFTAQVREVERRREQSQNRLMSSEQKFSNLKIVYGQVEQAANQYRSQFESLKVYCQRREEEHQQQLNSIQANNSAKINDFMARQAFLEKRMSEVVTQTQSEYGRSISELETRNQSLQQRYTKEMHDYQGKVKELRLELDLYATKGEEKCRRIADESSRKQAFYKEELNRLTNQLMYSNQQQRNSQLMREKQLMLENEELENSLNDQKQKFLKILQQVNDLKQQLSLTHLQHEARVQQLREKLKVAQNRLQQYRNEHGGRESRLNDQVKSLKDENYTLQAEKISFATKLQMSQIRIDELESENSHLKNEIQETRHRQRMSLYQVHGGSNHTLARGVENHLQNHFRSSVNMPDHFSEDSNAHFDAMNSGVLRTVFPDEDVSYPDPPTEFRTVNRGSAYKWKHDQTDVAIRPASAYKIGSTATSIPTVDMHVNFNYSKYYEQNIKQIKSNMLSNHNPNNSSSPPQQKPFRFSKMIVQGEQSRQEVVVKKTSTMKLINPKVSLQQGSHPNIPRSPKMFAVGQSPSPDRSPTSFNSPEYAVRPIPLNINNAMSTQSLNLETEPSELQIGSSGVDNQITGYFQQYHLQ